MGGWLLDTPEIDTRLRNGSLIGKFVEKHERSRTVPDIPYLTIFAFENMLIERLIKAFEHYETVLRQHDLQGKRHTKAERLGMFCTSVRTELGNHSHSLRGDLTRSITHCLTKPDNWSDALVPKYGYGYNYGSPNNKIKFADGEWTLNYDKMTELSRAAQTSHLFASDEAVLQSECTASLLLVERSIPTLHALADHARLINIESDKVLANMMSIAESLER